MRENRPYGLEGGEAGSTGLPYPYACVMQSFLAGPAASWCSKIVADDSTMSLRASCGVRWRVRVRLGA